MRRMHPTWLLTAACLAIVVGVAWAPLWSPTVWYSLVWLLTGVVAVSTAMLWPRRCLIILVIVGGLVVGLWRGAQEQMALTLYDPVIGQAVAMRGVVTEDADTNKRGDTLLRLGHLESRGQTLPGALWLTVGQRLDIRRGDTVVFEGKLDDGFGGFAVSVRQPHVVAIERPEPGDPALELRDKFASSVRQVVSDPQASLGIGYVVGQRRALPEELDQALRIAGLTHIVVASGYNLTILIRFARRLLARISRYSAAAASAGLIASFIAITGMSPSMMRAGLVSGLALWAWYVGRRFHPVTLLAFALAVTVLVQPNYAWGDMGWALSFAAFAGVMILAPLVHAYFWGTDRSSSVRQITIETLSAQLATAPILVMAFGKLSLIAPLSNVLVLPLVPLAMLLTFVAGVVQMIVPGLTLIGLPAQWLLGYMTWVAETSARVSWAQVSLEATFWGALGYYVLLALGCGYMRWRSGYRLRDANIVE